MYAGDAQSRGKKFQRADDAKIVWQAPDLNTGDLEQAMRYPGCWTRRSGAPIVKGHEVTLIGPIIMNTRVDSTRSSNTELMIESPARMGISSRQQAVLRVELRNWLRRVDLCDDPGTWLLSPDQPPNGDLRWYKELLENINCPRDLMLGWTIGNFTEQMVTDILNCCIDITW